MLMSRSFWFLKQKPRICAKEVFILIGYGLPSSKKCTVLLLSRGYKEASFNLPCTDWKRVE